MKQPIETSNFFNEEQHLNDQGIALAVDALQLDRWAELPERLLTHLEKCPDCKREVLSLFDLTDDQNYPTSGEHPFFSQSGKETGPPGEGNWRFLLRIAAIIAAIAGLSIYVIWSGSNSGEPEQITADTFAPSPTLEDLINSEYRASSIVVISPVNGKSYHGEVVFEWTTQAPEPVYVKILNNRETVVAEVRTEETKYRLQKKLSPGRYYWKLETDDELLYLGMFFWERK